MGASKETRIVILLVIDTVFCLIEAITGYAVHSLALVADSFHMLNDIFSLVVALWAVRVAKNRGADAKYTYGWQRAEILGALINAVFLLALCITIFIEAIQRFITPEVITNPQLILWVGVAGLTSNFIGLFLFHDIGHGGHSHSHGGDSFGENEEEGAGHYHDHAGYHDDESHSHSHGGHYDEEAAIHTIEPVLPEDVVAHELHKSHNHETQKKLKNGQDGHSLNMRGVFLHVLGDALGNIGVIVSALLIWKTDYTWRFYFDPAISLFITAIIFSTALPLCRSASKILLQATPSTISADHVQEDVLAIPGVVAVHDLHIWNLTEQISIASLHAELNVAPDSFTKVVDDIRTCLHAYGVQSVTVQPEFIDPANSSISDSQSSHNSTNETYGAISNCTSGFKK
ncbi:Zn(2+) transporter [Saccharomycopsis crataegensis]|uniref:Zn(2+) transporter n=1 Tax=Saccharomycopsis crataegensis TaxID=43959 RepID=A0AAV5QRJ9_9ASCO|nr:Zn(2+) transporter [Saccharomycopsis crataegensis]